eukprot:GHVR01066828.1.p1 GENE.GHVR01066828.1~~GHVR01066828.1.p1  ORF type:complete len:814 (+),score=99.18 GHVR01066828.1:57-2498(+)
MGLSSKICVVVCVMSISKIIGQPLKLAIGEDFFDRLVTKYDVFVDKTLFVKEIIDSSEKAILITYPRRWGKSLNLDTLKVFFEIESTNGNKNKEKEESFIYSFIPGFLKTNQPHDNISINKKLFTDHNLKITQVSNGQYMQYQGKYPVISFSLKDITGNSIEEITEALKDKIKELYKNFRYLMENSELYDDEKNDFQKYITMDYNGISLENGIKFLSELLYKHHKEAVYVLIDEYDTPVSELLEQHLGEKQLQLPEKVSELISQMVCSSISKTNPYVEKLILTGVFDTIYKGTTTGCNNIRSYGISDKRFSESFGFTTEEVKILIDKFKGKAPFDNKEKIFNIIKDWYGGYFVPTVTIDSSANYLKSDSNLHTEVFAPWAVMNFLYDSYANNELLPKTYWSKTGYKTILERLFTQEKCKNSSLSKKFLEISENVTYELNFDNQISLFKYDWHSDIDNEAFFSHLLLNSGYLAGKEVEGIFKFSIPNRELLSEFTTIIPKSNKNCGIILENLQKNRQLEILEMIRKNDLSEDFINKFENKFTTYKINCTDNTMNFNFVSLAIIYSNKKVYEHLKTRCPDDIPDNANYFTVLDYASVLQRKFVNYTINDTIDYDNVHSNLYNFVYLVSNSYWGEEFITTMQRFIPFIIVSSTMELFNGNIDRIAYVQEHPNVKNIIKYFTLFISFVPGGLINKFLSTKEYCQEYTDYQKINITKPNEFTTLKHVKKYTNHYNNVYIMIDSECREQEDTITEITQQVFKTPYVINENIKFTLCQSTASQQEKSLDNVFKKECPQCTEIDYPQKELVHGETEQPDEL